MFLKELLRTHSWVVKSLINFSKKWKRTEDEEILGGITKCKDTIFRNIRMHTLTHVNVVITLASHGRPVSSFYFSLRVRVVQGRDVNVVPDVGSSNKSQCWARPVSLSR